ncbi:MAG: TSUP family transporter, partial [Actinomycetota bacterium]|nr:TSUP family transporter [Actinomycetota bacterium]
MNWIYFAIAGSLAQLIDGALGMGFGLTSSTLLLTLGASAAVASAAVHAAEIGTTLVSGASHWHAENIDKKVLVRLAIPGGIGAFLGATFLSSIDLSSSKIFISTLLLFMGFLLLYRNLFQTTLPTPSDVQNNPRYLR